MHGDGGGLQRLPSGTAVRGAWFSRLPWRRQELVGLDIGSRAVKAVELRRRRGACSLAAFGVAALPAGAVDDGAIADPDAVAHAVRTLLDGHGFGTRSVALAVGGNAVMVRRIELPAMGAEELDASIYWEARRQVPFPADEVVLDYQLLRSPAGPDAAGTCEVLLVAARKDRVAAYTDVVERAGCVPVVIDVDACALLNAHALNAEVEAGAATALVDVGASTVGVTVAAGGQPVGTRELPFGARSYVEALRNELGLSAADAERRLHAQRADEPLAADTHAVMRAVNERLAAEIGGTLDFFRGSEQAGAVGSLVLCGGASRVAGLADALADGQRTRVDLFDPFRRVAGAAGRCGEDGALAAVAVGLALRQAGDG